MTKKQTWTVTVIEEHRVPPDQWPPEAKARLAECYRLILEAAARKRREAAAREATEGAE